MKDTDVRKFISQMKKELIKEKRQALDFLRKVEYGKDMDLFNLEKELKSLDQRENRLKKILDVTISRLKDLSKNHSSLKQKQINHRKRISSLRQSIVKLKGVEREYENIHKQLEPLLIMKNHKIALKHKLSKQEVILRNKLMKVRVQLSTLNKKQIAPLQRKIQRLRDKKVQKKLNQNVVSKLSREISRLQTDIKKSEKLERLLRSKKREILTLRSELSLQHSRKKSQKKKLLDSIKRLKDQEKKVDLFNL